jgi:hypothetical protein
MILLLFGHPPAFYVIATTALTILFALVALGNRILGLLRNLRNFRDGHLSEWEPTP